MTTATTSLRLDAATIRRLEAARVPPKVGERIPPRADVIRRALDKGLEVIERERQEKGTQL